MTGAGTATIPTTLFIRVPLNIATEKTTIATALRMIMPSMLLYGILMATVMVMVTRITLFRNVIRRLVMLTTITIVMITIRAPTRMQSKYAMAKTMTAMATLMKMWNGRHSGMPIPML